MNKRIYVNQDGTEFIKAYNLENEIEQVTKLPNTLAQTYVQLADYVGQTQFKNIKITA